VRLQYDVAGIGTRSAAALIDTAIQAIVGIALTVLITLAFSLIPFAREAVQGPFLAGVGIGLLILETVGTFLVVWGYYLFFELAWSGQTPGKRSVGIRVIRQNGYPIRPWDAVVRNLVRIIDGPPFGAALGLLVMLLNAQSRRLGDLAAGTIVIREAKPQILSSLTAADEGRTRQEQSTPPTDQPSRPAAGLPTLRAQDATLVRDFLVRRHNMETQARASLAHRLAARLAEAYGMQTQTAIPDEAFLESLTRT
jgi:uncharacterized RDD family membrane protein YckC